jgi:hypothetical protein
MFLLASEAKAVEAVREPRERFTVAPVTAKLPFTTWTWVPPEAPKVHLPFASVDPCTKLEAPFINLA